MEKRNKASRLAEWKDGAEAAREGGIAGLANHIPVTNELLDDVPTSVPDVLACSTGTEDMVTRLEHLGTARQQQIAASIELQLLAKEFARLVSFNQQAGAATTLDRIQKTVKRLRKQVGPAVVRHSIFKPA